MGPHRHQNGAYDRSAALRLDDFLSARGIAFVDTYVSDIQGMDLQVLKSLESFIRNRQIGTLVCETTKDAFGNIYRDLPDSSETGFKQLPQDNYVLSARCACSKLRFAEKVEKF
jgi:hypothetical protein